MVVDQVIGALTWALLLLLASDDRFTHQFERRQGPGDFRLGASKEDRDSTLVTYGQLCPAGNGPGCTSPHTQGHCQRPVGE